MKKTASKPTFGSVTVTHGHLDGMEFLIEDQTPVSDGRVRIKYKAPDNGPRAVVEHVAVRGEFRIEDRIEDVRIAFSKLIPASISWSADRGYSGRTSGTALAWDRQRARFVVTNETKGPVNDKLDKEIQEDNGE